jgi:serine/threonine protein phosphatase 1
MRLLAIGDIHGCSQAFDALLTVVAPTADDWLITLGDYVDRGPDSRGVIERLIDLNTGGRLVALLGNHEEMMLDARYAPAAFAAWVEFGGQETLDSYPARPEPGLPGVPDEHWRFLEQTCIDRFETDRHFFVHGNVLPDVPISDQPIEVLHWEKFGPSRPHISGKTMICGHTAQRNGRPRDLGHAVCIDTYAYGGGWLTCLDAASGFYWQANQKGDTRTGQLA